MPFPAYHGKAASPFPGEIPEAMLIGQTQPETGQILHFDLGIPKLEARAVPFVVHIDRHAQDFKDFVQLTYRRSLLQLAASQAPTDSEQVFILSPGCCLAARLTFLARVESFAMSLRQKDRKDSSSSDSAGAVIRIIDTPLP
ncbi:hypothetical protein AK812_SmicGene41844 [Symbiodinium microadriaticum]|uniref:Uncharacterized protein n=1 Tax=Symbiodinium microadriaticum TaxID=2951 RepID=A0A1Q9C539_SYMMI|nr:hypothetical protein AK812_SmicGene41844 [Symbiodinium microadriaticum]